jgi:hypothetical protein
MQTMAQRIKGVETTVTVIQGGSKSRIRDPELARAVSGAHSLWLRMRELEAELAKARAIIAGRAGELVDSGVTVSFESGGIRCTVAFRREATVPEENVAALKKLLGRRFKDLVRTKVSYTATRRLLEQAGDDELGLIRVRQLSPQFKWSSEGRPSL